MKIDGLSSLIQLAIASLRTPKKSLRIILDLVITMPELIQATALVVALSMMLPIISLMFQPAQVQEAMKAYSTNPIPVFFLQLGILIGSAAIINFISQIFKGYGTFKEMLTAMVWMQFILIIIQVLQLVISIIAPQLNGIILLFSLMIMVYLTVNFIMEVNGFTNAFAVTAGVFGSFFGIALILSILLAILGITPEVIQNV